MIPIRPTKSLLHNALALRALLVMLVALALKAIYPRGYRKKQIWVVGERNGHCHKDNGYALFQYCANNVSNVSVYFVMSARTYHDHRLDANAHKHLKYGSIKHAFVCVFADAILYTVSYRDITYKLLFRLIPSTTTQVFLQHGVVGLKNISTYIKNDNLHSADIVISASNKEKHILTHLCGFDSEKVRITGLSRFDYLPTTRLAIQQSAALKLLYIPTLRSWLPPQEFVDGPLNAHITPLSANPRLNHILNCYNATLDILPHPAYGDAFLQLDLKTNQRVKIVDARRKSILERITDAHVLITDYSSLTFDFIYMQKPVLFYRFDLDEYMRHCGSYLPMESTTLGPVATTNVELIGLIDQCLGKLRSSQTSDASPSLRQSSFAFVDDQNSSRICAATIAEVQLKQHTRP